MPRSARSCRRSAWRSSLRANDAVIGAVLVVFALAEMAYTRTFPSLHGQAYGPDLFPLLIGVGLCACGAVLIARGLLARRAATTAAPWYELEASLREPAVRINLVLLLLSLVLYILLSESIGFIPMSFAILALLFARLGSTPALSLSLAAATTAVLHLLFSKVLLVPLPSGLLQGLPV